MERMFFSNSYLRYS